MVLASRLANGSSDRLCEGVVQAAHMYISWSGHAMCYAIARDIVV